MMELSATAYLWIKALHIIAVISWMAGLLYLPRLFVYHTEATPGSAQSETFKVMERRLMRFIMNPAMIVALSTGIVMIIGLGGLGALGQGWLHLKLVLALGLVALHMVMARWRREFADDRNTRSGRFYRIANEAPTVLMIGIVVLAVVKPF